LKQVADELAINYSTAKTIVQTFRKERRITKKPKRSLETKKAIKRERYLSKCLTQSKVARIISRIMEDELIAIANDVKCTKQSEPQSPIAEVSTAIATSPPSGAESPPTKTFPRITSANQMVLFPNEEEGPRPGQVTRAVATEYSYFPVSKKDIFYVYSEINPEEEYRDRVDYANPVVLRAKTSIRETEGAPIAKLPLISALASKSAFAPPTQFAHSEPQEATLFFTEYSLKIIMNSFER